VIGRLRGELVAKHPPALLLDVGGVGYELEAPMSTFYTLPETGARVTLLTHLAIRDDAHVLYGFARETERDLFRALLRVSGVGPRLALAILSGMTAEEFARCVQAGDTAALVRLPGIGKRTAERLVVEMRDRVDSLSPGPGTAVSLSPAALSRSGEPADEAVSALVALGYRPADATRMVRAVMAPDLTSEELIRAALKAAARG
jgi:Holliday junction DNA helicase RuvA